MNPTILQHPQEDEIIQRLRTAQYKGAQERVAQTGKLITDTLNPEVTDTDREMAKIWRTENSIARGDTLYLKYREQLNKTILQYMENLGIEGDILRFVEKMLDGVQYRSTYTEENPNILEEPGSMGEVSTCFADISHLPVVVSMRHVQDMAGWNMGEDITSGKLTVEEAIERQYLCVLLHELLHVASIRIYELDNGYIGRVGIHFVDEAAESIGDLNMSNEGLTDIIAGRIFHSESMGKYYPGYSKYFSKIYHDIMIATQRDSGTFQETMNHVEKGYFGSLEYANLVRVNIFDAESVF